MTSRLAGPSACLFLFLLAACGGGGDSTTGAVVDPPPTPGTGRTFAIAPGPNATTEMVDAMVQLAPGDTIAFAAGYYELDASLFLTNTEDVKVKGAGKDLTVLSFKNSPTQEGVLAVNVHGLTIEDLTVLDSTGNGFEFRGVSHGTLRRVRAFWSSGGGKFSATPVTAANYADGRLHVACTDPATLNPDAPENEGGDTRSPDYTVSEASGRYGIYPVSSSHILIEHAESVGASDAGIYVGQTDNAIIRDSRAAFNVFGFEIENVQGGEYARNVAECNTGGFLIYDLDGLQQYGARSRMYGNKAINNNTYNFTAGGFVANVPPGSGMITLSYDQIDIFDNEFRDNNTAGIIHTSYAIFPPGDRPSDMRIDWYSEGVHIFRNKFVNNGNDLPEPTTNDIQNQDVAKFLPALVGLKNAAGCVVDPAACAGVAPATSGPYRGAHILWDGLADAYDAACEYPVDAQGQPVPHDADGKPILGNDVPNPDCHYNAYKFDTTQAGAPRIKPKWWFSCIDDDNEFADDSLAFANFHGTRGLEAVITNELDPSGIAEFPASFDRAPHDCPTAYGANLPPLPPISFPPFQRTGEFDPAPAAAEVARLCGAATAAGQVNFAAARVNCPLLSQYNLFAEAAEPRSTPNGGGVPFVLNTKLFSDYSVKYRVLYLPPGTKAVYADNASGGPSATIQYPTGTIIAKTFAFADEEAGTEVPVETRLLIKRVNSRGMARWDGLPYLWTVENGQRVARLAMGGRSLAVAWDHTDVDSGVVSEGSTASYSVPNANQCLSCHAGSDKEPGASPIGTKVRFLNRAFRPESDFATGQGSHASRGQNQIAYLCAQGLMAGCPADLGVNAATQVATRLEHAPIFNKPGDAGFPAHSDPDIEARARAYLEVNCQHCHNPQGFAANTGFYLDSFRRVDATYGICKGPTAAGREGTGGRTVDIHPGHAELSILEYRLSPGATSSAARMPPLARSVVHAEGHALITQWINEVVVADEDKYPGSTRCGN